MEQINITSLDGEEWRDIPGYEGYYMVSSMGRVKSLYGCNRILKLENSKGYRRFHASLFGIKKNILVHRMVAIAFIKNFSNKPFVNHINGITHDNRISNLEWVTQQENSIHSYRVLGRKIPKSWENRYGSDNHRAKSVIQYDSLGKIIGNYGCISDASTQLGVDEGSISRCCRGIRKTAGGYIWKYK